MEDIINRLKDLARQIPNVPCVYQLELPTFGDGTAETQIRMLESQLTASLPPDFIFFQQRCGCISAMDIWNGYALFDASHILALMNDRNSPISIRLTEAQHIVPIGGDGGGNLFVMSLDEKQVFKLNHETGELKVLANAFADFLQRMCHDWEHFLAGDDKWEYMSG